MQYIGSLETAEKLNSAKIFKENIITSVMILQKDLYGSSRFSATIFPEPCRKKILQICTGLQRSKTWDFD